MGSIEHFDGARVCANCKHFAKARAGLSRLTYYCRWDSDLREVKPDSRYCMAFGTGCDIDSENTHWEPDRNPGQGGEG